MPKHRRRPAVPVVDLIGEVWRPIPDYPGYEVSNKGRVKSHKRLGVDYPTLLAPIASREYLKVTLHYVEGGKRKSKKQFIHKLVLLAFTGPAGPSQVCLHNDGNPHNNCLTNLKWGTQRENAEDKRRHGTLLMGESHPNTTLTNADVEAIWKLLKTTPLSYSKIGRKFGVSRHTVSRIAIGTTWGHVTKKLPKAYPEE